MKIGYPDKEFIQDMLNIREDYYKKLERIQYKFYKMKELGLLHSDDAVHMNVMTESHKLLTALFFEFLEHVEVYLNEPSEKEIAENKEYFEEIEREAEEDAQRREREANDT